MIPEHAQRTLALEAPGGPAQRLAIVAPSIARPGEPFAVKLAALDCMGYPSVECDGAAEPIAGPAEGLTQPVRFEHGKPAVGGIGGLTLGEEGLFRVGFDFGGETFFSNPIRCHAKAEERIFWGDPHVHTVLSDCHPDRCRSLDFCFVCARYVTGLDWVCAADHVSNGRGSPGKWKAQRAAAGAFNDPARFATLLGYEASLKGGAGGDNNVYFADDAEAYVDVYEDGDVRTLSEALDDWEHILVPHHTTRTGKHGELSERLYLGPERMPVVEIHSKWGTSECRGNRNALHQVHPGPSYAQDFLAQGCAFGFIAGTDTHATMPSGYGEEAGHIDRLPGLTAVRAPAATRTGIFSAIRSRNCYATSAERILVECSIAGSDMGQEIAWPGPTAPRLVTAVVAAESNITRVDVVRNGEDVYSQAGDGWKAQVEWTDEEPLADAALPPGGAFDGPFVYYYLRVTCESGAQAWTSPVWLTL